MGGGRWRGCRARAPPGLAGKAPGSPYGCALRAARAFQSEKLWSPRGHVARANDEASRVIGRGVWYSVLRGWVCGAAALNQVSEKVPPFETSMRLKLLRGRRRHT